MSASPSPSGKKLYEFGPFRVDPDKQLLLRQGEPVALTPKTFQILLVLIRHNKEVVTKDDLMKAVWPDTFVEEANLSRNIFMLRKALGDSSQDRYIVTVPGRGYRLAEDVQLVPERELSVVAASHTRMQVEVKETKPWRWVALAALVVAAGVGTAWIVSHGRPALTEKDSVMIADFENTTGDVVFDGTLEQGLAVQLEQSPYLSLVPEERIRRTLTMMGRNPEEKISGQTAREACERTGAAAVLEGSITSLGSQYVLGMRAKDCRSGAVIDEEQVQVERKEDVLKALTQIASRFRSRIGESISSVREHNVPLEEATTPSLEALKAYDTAVDIGLSQGIASGVPLMKHAIELDPNFALAYAHLGLWYSSLGEVSLAKECNTKAFELRNRVSERERFFITALYERDSTGDLERSYETLNSWAAVYPRDYIVHGLLSGLATQGLGKYEESIEESRKSLELEPDRGPPYANRAFSYLYTGKLAEAEATVNEALSRKFQLTELYLVRYHVAALRNDKGAMESAAAIPAGVPAQDWMVHAQALTAARQGRLGLARRTSERAVSMALAAKQRETAGSYEVAEAVYDAFYGDAEAAQHTAAEALKLSDGRDVEYGAAFAFAVSGDYAKAQELADDLEKRYPEDTSVRLSYLPTLRALFALHRGEPEKAVEELEPAAPHELGQTGISFFGFFGNMYPTYVRGEAYMAEHKYTEAAAEFEKIRNRPGMVLSDAMGAIAQLELARSCKAAGENAKAIDAYKQLLQGWKDADDNNVVRRAREESRLAQSTSS